MDIIRYLVFSLFFIPTMGLGLGLESFAPIAEKTIPGVVNIRTKAYVRKPVEQDLYECFLDGHIPRSHEEKAIGTGIIVSSDGYIVTNHHVIDMATSIQVILADGRHNLNAELVGSDLRTDLALLKVKHKKPLPPLSFGNSSGLRIGDIVLAIGNPFGLSHTVTNGILSAKGRVIGSGPYDEFLQTDASIHQGNSGGPLIDTRGRVIGINTAVSTKGHGIGFAIPSNTVLAVVSDLKKYGKVLRPWMGVIGKSILNTDSIEALEDPGGVYGVMISNLIVDGPAYRSGLKVGDLIMAIDGQKLQDLSSVGQILGKKRPKEKIELKVYRKGKGMVNLPFTLEEIPRTQDLPKEQDLF